MPEIEMHPNLPQRVLTREGAEPGTRQPVCKAAGRNPQAAEESLIYAVYKRRPLWDPRVHFYRNNTVVKLLWEEVARETGLIEAQARTRWKSLRDYYRIESKKISKSDNKASKKSGWTYFQPMSFLEELLCPTETPMSRSCDQSEESLSAGEESMEAAESLLSISAKESSSNFEIKTEAIAIELDEKKVENVEIKWEAQPLSVTNDHPVDSTSVRQKDAPQLLGVRNPLIMRPNFDLMYRKLLIQLENRRLELLERSAKIEEDDDLLFFKSLLPMFKNLSDSKRMRMRLKFQEMLCTEVEGSKPKLEEA